MRIDADIPWKILTFLLAFFDGLEAMENQMPGTLHRQLRQLNYPDDSEMGLFFALAIPLDDPVSTKSMSVAFFFEANYGLPNKDEDGERMTRRKRDIDRKTVYSMLESKFENFGLPGRGCLLRFICETSKSPIHQHNGLVGDLLRIVLTPSSSADEGLPYEYKDAERIADKVDDCGTTYYHCPVGIYDYITSIESTEWSRVLRRREVRIQVTKITCQEAKEKRPLLAPTFVRMVAKLGQSLHVTLGQHRHYIGCQHWRKTWGIIVP